MRPCGRRYPISRKLAVEEFLDKYEAANATITRRSAIS